LTASSPNFTTPTTLEDARALEIEEEEEPTEKADVGLPSWVNDIPKKYLKSIKSYTNHDIDVEELMAKGLDYCRKNNWEIHDDLAYIDQVSGALRYVYNDTYEEYVVLSSAQRRELYKKHD